MLDPAATEAICGGGRSGRLGDDLLQQRFVDRSGHGLDTPVGPDDNEGRLIGDAETGVHLTGIVADLGERQAMPIDEVLERVVAAGPGDADEVGGSGELSGDLLDRGGFTIADASSGRPEPQHGR